MLCNSMPKMFKNLCRPHVISINLTLCIANKQPSDDLICLHSVSVSLPKLASCTVLVSAVTSPTICLLQRCVSMPNSDGETTTDHKLAAELRGTPWHALSKQPNWLT